MARLTMSFLGTIQVTLKQKPITHFRSSNNQGLLVYLALQSERPHPREVLATLLWPEETDKHARNNLRQALYRLRKLLGDLEEPTEPYLLTTRETVQFNEESDYALDVEQFVKAVEAGNLENAVDLYHGEFLPGFTCDSAQFEDWLRQEREALHRLALEVMYQVTQDYLQAGRLDGAQAMARRQIALEPWRERAHRQLMRAYALAGDRGNALAQYEACRETLWTELGVEPAPDTVALQEAIQEGRLGPLHAETAPTAPQRVRHNLPAETTPLIGRELELQQLERMLIREERRLVTIVGPGGIGKTRLALAVATSLLPQYQDGIYFVELAPLAKPDEIGEAVAATLDFQAPDKSRDLWPQLLRALSRQQLLLVLDNYEHLLAGTGLVDEMLRHCPGLSLLVTSRQRLNLASESRYELGGLAFPDHIGVEEPASYTAVQLFVDGARRARADFRLSQENVADVIDICRLVEGMPLGLLLATAWLELLSPAEIADEIQENLRFLAAELADLPPRQRSIQAVFERSWKMLSVAEQQVLAGLSVFRGGFTREAAATVTGADLRLLLGLVHKSLLQREEDGGRFVMHELLRQYTAEKRRESDPDDEVLRAHCRYFARLVSREVRRSLSLAPLNLPRESGADRDNLRQAWEYALQRGLATELSDMARGMLIFSWIRGRQPTYLCREAIDVLRRQGVQETDRTLLHLRLLELFSIQGKQANEKVKGLFLDFIPLVEQNGDAELCFWTYHLLAKIHAELGDPASTTFYERAQERARAGGDEVLVKQATVWVLWNRLKLGLPTESAFVRLTELLNYFKRERPKSDLVFLIRVALCVERRVSEAYEASLLHGERALEMGKEWREVYWLSFAAGELADTYLQMGEMQAAGLARLEALQWHLAVARTWQTLGFLWATAAHVPELVGGPEPAVTTLSMAYHHPEAIPYYRQEIDKALSPFEAELGRDRFTSAWERGKELDFDSAVAQMQAALVAAGDNSAH